MEFYSKLTQTTNNQKTNKNDTILIFQETSIAKWGKGKVKKIKSWENVIMENEIRREDY